MDLLGWTFTAAVVADIAGTVIGIYDLSHRLPLLRNYMRPVGRELPMTWNTHESAIYAALGSRQPEIVEARSRAANNELIRPSRMNVAHGRRPRHAWQS